MWGYNPSHRCCILAVQENRVLYKVFQSLSLCPVLAIHFHHLTYHCCNLAVWEDLAQHMVFQSLSLCPLLSLHCDHPVIATVVTSLFRRTE